MNSYDPNTEAGATLVCPAHPKGRHNPETGLECAYCEIEAMVDFYETRDEELTGLEEHLRDSPFQGDARRCPRHPGVKTSSDDGMFDGVCGLCESEADDDTQAWAVDPSNTTRALCDAGVWFPTTPWHGAASCLDEAAAEDDICF